MYVVPPTYPSKYLTFLAIAVYSLLFTNRIEIKKFRLSPLKCCAKLFVSPQKLHQNDNNIVQANIICTLSAVLGKQK